MTFPTYQAIIQENADFRVRCRPIGLDSQVLLAAHVVSVDLRIYDLDAPLRRADGFVRFTSQPNVGDTIAIADGQQRVTLEFVDSVALTTAGFTGVLRGATFEDTASNFARAVNGLQAKDLVKVLAEINANNVLQVDLEHRWPGSVGNVPLFQSIGSEPRFTIDGMDGGRDTTATVFESIGMAAAEFMQAALVTATTDPGWRGSPEGYSFLGTVQASDYNPQGGHRYVVAYQLNTLGDGAVPIVIELTTNPAPR